MLWIYFWVWLLNSCAIYSKIPHQHQPVFLHTKWKCWLSSGNVVPKDQTAEPEWDIMWTLYPNDLLHYSLLDSTEEVYMGTGKLKMTSVLQGSPCKSPFCHANFLPVSFYLSFSSFNCLFLHMHGEFGWTFPSIFLCGWKEENHCFSQQFTWTDFYELVQLQEENIKKSFWNWQFLPI